MTPTEKLNSNFQWWVAGVFFLLALSFVFDIWGTKREVVKHDLVDPEFFSKQPVRQPRLEPTLERNGEKFRCNDCHQNIVPSSVQRSFVSSHPEIILDHGANNYCTTCHSLNNRETLIDMNNEEINFSQSSQMCFKCHGTIYRDWERGVHGRMNQYWDKSKGPVVRYACVNCHDPHSPKFKPMIPAPAPKLTNYRDFLKNYQMKESTHE